MRLDADWLKDQGPDGDLLNLVDIVPFSECPDKVAVAVSGGGDSMTLLHLYMRWSAKTGVPIIAVTVDHGLRAAAADEAAFVAAFCAEHGVPHVVLNWDGAQAVGNIQAAAREARYRLIAAWALENGTDAVVLGHTADDVAETFLMRLARKSGVDGLAAMRSVFYRNYVQWARPLLPQTRMQLRDYLVRHNLRWIEDPSNDDVTQTRPRARKILAALAPLGIDVEEVAATATALGSARSALEYYASDEARRVVTLDRGDVLMPLHPHPPLHPEIYRRLVKAAVQFISGADYAPRESAFINMDAALIDHDRHTVGGCLIIKDGETLRIARELKAVGAPMAWRNRSFGKFWDTRWAISEDPDCNTAGDLTIGALGEHINDVPDWRDVGLSRASLMATPAVFDGDTLISAPIAGLQNGFSARIVADFHSFLLSR